MMQARKARYLEIERSVSFADISSWCLIKRETNRLIVAVRPYIDLDDRVSFDPRIVDSVESLFGGNIIRETSAIAWPGTRLIEHVGKVYEVAFDTVIQRRMIETHEYLSGWKQSNEPPLPEDICLYSEGDEWPTLVSVTHDGNAWLLKEKSKPHFTLLPTTFFPLDLVPPPPNFIVGAVL